MSNKIKQFRKKAGLTQEWLALYSGYSQAYIARAETSPMPVSERAKKAIVRVLRRKLKDKTLTVGAVFK